VPPPLVLPDRTGLRTALDRALAQAAARTGSSLRDDVGRELAIVLVGRVLTRATRSPRVPVELLGAGLATWPISGGFGLLAALVVDQVLDWLWDWWRDPRGGLARLTAQRLDELHRALVEGTEAAPGLRRCLIQFARERCAARRAAVLGMIERSGGN
jgi:hypothetical protein